MEFEAIETALSLDFSRHVVFRDGDWSKDWANGIEIEGLGRLIKRVDVHQEESISVCCCSDFSDRS